jgi:Beta-galactosidase
MPKLIRLRKWWALPTLRNLTRRKILKLLLAFLGAMVLLFARDAIWQWTVVAPGRSADLQIGTTFIKINAEHLGLDWRSAYKEILNDVGIKQIRIPIFWDQLEREPGQFDWADLDWQMQEAAQANAQVMLVVGHRVPRYPECYAPSWTKGLDNAAFKRSLLAMTETVVKHYRDHPALGAWQVENEPLAKILGKIWGDGSCREISHLVREEVQSVRQWADGRWSTTDGRSSDGRRIPTVVTYANAPWFVAQLRKTLTFESDVVAMTLFNKLYFRSPLFTGYVEMFRLGPLATLRLAYQRSVILRNHQALWIAEMQAEPWGPEGPYKFDRPEDAAVTMNPARLRQTWDYAVNGGASRIYLWGIEWCLSERDRGRSQMLDAVKGLVATQ